MNEDKKVDRYRTGPPPARLGALVGWQSFPTSNGVALRLETAASLEEAKRGALDLSDVTLSITQMRALAHNLTQIADQQQGVKRPSRRRWLW